MISAKKASKILMDNFLIEATAPDDDFNKEVADAFFLGATMLEKEIVKPPEFTVNRFHPILGKAHYCQCGVMLLNWDDRSQQTNYCGNCGQKLR